MREARVRTLPQACRASSGRVTTRNNYAPRCKPSLPRSSHGTLSGTTTRDPGSNPWANSDHVTTRYPIDAKIRYQEALVWRICSFFCPVAITLFKSGPDIRGPDVPESFHHHNKNARFRPKRRCTIYRRRLCTSCTVCFASPENC